MNAIETHRLSRRFGKAEALHGLDLTVPSGSVYAFIGPNGAGKTTTIRMLMNLLEPTSGEALHANDNASATCRRTRSCPIG
jgi:ABC-2 type transport system ATP-binding protein